MAQIFAGLTAILNDVWDAANHWIRVNIQGAVAGTTADCADVTQGCIADAAVTGDSPGTVNAHLRGIDKILGDVWDSVNHWLRVGAEQVGAWTVGVNNFPAKQAVTVADGDDVTLGAKADAAVTGDNSGTISAKLRGVLKILTDVWSSADHTLFSRLNVALVSAPAGSMTVGGASTRLLETLLNSVTGAILGDGLIVSYPVINGVDNGVGIFNLRTPSVFKTVAAAAAGNTALWTPAVGKKFRLMRYRVTVTDNATQAVAGVLTVNLLDAAGNIAQTDDVFVPAVALVNSGALYNGGQIDLGNGILSAVANNVLNVNLSAALVTGNVRVIACGTEE
jgi:hypothetical protein